MIELKNDDCLNILKKIPDKCIDLFVTDCPYHITSGGCSKGIYGNDKTISNKMTGGIFDRRRNFKSNNYNEESVELARKGKLFKYNDIEFSQWLPDVYRVLKDKTHCYIMVNGRNLKKLQIEAEKVGFIYQNLLVWKKNNATPNRYYLNNCEFIIMFRKGKAKNINNMGTKNVLEIPNIIGKKTHPTEKPVELMKVLIQNSSNVGDIIFDPFMGTASTGIACQETGRNFLGIEIDKKYFDIAKERIEKNSKKEAL